jgi:hypothetical protein
MNRISDSARWKRVLFLIAVGALVGWMFMFLIPEPDAAPEQIPKSAKDSSADASAPIQSGTGANASDPVSIPPPPTNMDAILIARFDAAAAQLARGIDRLDARALLADLADSVAAADSMIAAQSLIAFLETGRDAATGLGFQVAEGGTLSEAPSLRVAVLDFLGRTGAPQAADYAIEVMDATAVADEYSVALRNLAWGVEDTSEVGARFSDMLDRDAWLSEPTAGFMEAFDVAVAVGGPQMVRELSQVALGESEITTGETPRLNQPAFIALDRLMMRDPDAVVAAFRSDPELLSWAPTQRASLLSRLDVRDKDQRVLVENYLLSPNHGPDEMEYFKNIFPNVNGIDGNRMVTESTEIRNVAEIDNATRAVLTEWQGDTRFAGVRPILEAIAQRLNQNP